MAGLTVEVVKDYHPSQLEVAKSTARFKVLIAGRRWGKTRMGTQEVLDAGLAGKRAWWVAPTYPMATEGWRPLSKMAHLVPGAKVREVDRQIEFPGGGLVQVRSADDPNRLRGAGLDLLVLDECAFMKSEAWDVLRPALSDRQGKALFITTPKGRDNWVARIFDDATKPGWARWQLPSWDNPFLDRQEIEEARDEIGSLVFDQEYGAAFVSMQGQMFRPDWLRYGSVTVKDGLNWLHTDEVLDYREMTRFVTVDLAASTKTHADYTVICAVASMGKTMFVLDVDRRRMEGPDIVPAIRRMIERWDLDVAYIESVGFQLSIVQEARRDGLAVVELRADRDKIARATALQARMEAGDVWFNDGSWLPDLERELLSFPDSDHDDQVDALAYAARVVGQKPKAKVSARAFEGISRRSPNRL